MEQLRNENALIKAEEKNKQKEGQEILEALKKQDALRKAEEKTKQKEGQEILKAQKIQDELRKTEEKKIAASIKAQEKKQPTNTLKRLKQQFTTKKYKKKK